MSPKRTDASEPYAHRWWVLASVSLALFIALLDGTVVNVSIPAISKGIGATFSDAEWVLNAYTLVFASLLVTFGRLGDPTASSTRSHQKGVTTCGRASARA